MSITILWYYDIMILWAWCNDLVIERLMYLLASTIVGFVVLIVYESYVWRTLCILAEQQDKGTKAKKNTFSQYSNAVGSVALIVCLILWYYEIMILWWYDALILWYYDSMIRWYDDTIMSITILLILWDYDIMILWYYDTMILWCYDTMILWYYDTMIHVNLC